MLSKFTCSKAHLFCKGGTWMSQSHVKLKHLGPRSSLELGSKISGIPFAFLSVDSVRPHKLIWPDKE